MKATSDFHLTLHGILNKHNLREKDIVAASGYGKSSVSLVFTGGRNDASLSVLSCLEAIFELTGDSEVLLTGKRNVAVIEPNNIEPTQANIKSLVNNTQKAGEVLECLANVFADGVVDKNDKIAVEQLEEAVNSAVKTLIETKISVRDAYEKAIKQ